MQKLIKDEAATYARWAGGHHQTAVFNQYAGEWARKRMADPACEPAVRRNMLRQRICLFPMVAQSLERRDNPYREETYHTLIGQSMVVRVTK